MIQFQIECSGINQFKLSADSVRRTLTAENSPLRSGCEQSQVSDSKRQIQKRVSESERR